MLFNYDHLILKNNLHQQTSRK